MTRVSLLTIVLAYTLILGAGCALNRANVTALSKEQGAYYATLRKTMKDNRQTFEIGLKEQLKADLVRQQQLLEWRRDLAKAEVLLQVGSQVSKERKLLLLTLADLNLEHLKQAEALEEIDRSRLKVVLGLYDAVIKAAGALEKNNRAITEYLGSGDAEFAVRSLDVEGIVRATSNFRDLQAQLQGIEARSEEERRKDNARLQKNIERSRQTLIKAFEK